MEVKQGRWNLADRVDTDELGHSNGRIFTDNPKVQLYPVVLCFLRLKYTTVPALPTTRVFSISCTCLSL